MRKYLRITTILMIIACLCGCASGAENEETTETTDQMESSVGSVEKADDKALEEDKETASDENDKTEESSEVAESAESVETTESKNQSGSIESSESGSRGEVKRSNDESPSERLFDYADILTDDEEKALTDLIAECEERCKCDIILVLVDMEVGVSDEEWEENMMNYADGFYDENAFGYDKPHGDGVLYLDNWYLQGTEDSQAGSWVTTSGKAINALGGYELNFVFDEFDAVYEESVFEAYANVIKKLAEFLEEAPAT